MADGAFLGFIMDRENCLASGIYGTKKEEGEMVNMHSYSETSGIPLVLQMVFSGRVERMWAAHCLLRFPPSFTMVIEDGQEEA